MTVQKLLFDKSLSLLGV